MGEIFAMDVPASCEQARSHIGAALTAKFMTNPRPCGSLPAMRMAEATQNPDKKSPRPTRCG